MFRRARIQRHATRSAAIIVAAVAMSVVGSDCWAQPAAVKDQLKGMQSDIAMLTHRKPGLADVRVLLAGDCRAHFPDVAEPRQTAFCQCASTVTISLWLESDKQMVPLLNDYLSKPTKEKLNAFLRYQGPELYQQFCDSAVGA